MAKHPANAWSQGVWLRGNGLGVPETESPKISTANKSPFGLIFVLSLGGTVVASKCSLSSMSWEIFLNEFIGFILRQSDTLRPR